MNQVPDPTEAEIFASSDPFGQAGSAFSSGSGSAAFGATAPQPNLASTPGPAVTCVEVHRSMHIFLDGELSAPQHRALSDHLTACPPCRRAHSFQVELRSVVATKAIDPMPDDVRARIVRALGFE
jgi:mycothiol system anti-sigma-R factor